MKLLAIETSCDETAVAIVETNDCKIDNNNNPAFFDKLQTKILANIINSQINLHSPFGGVVPELAARSHLEIIDKLIIKALEEANTNLDDIDYFAATCGPGLIGGLIVGMMASKSLALLNNKKFLAVNHLEGHALTARFTHNITFPYLLLLLSGGHCQIILVKGVGNYQIIGSTIDDALGEAFDKTAKMLGLSYPGGPKIEKLAKNGDISRFILPKPLTDNPQHRYNFSFSGLKTAILRHIEKLKSQKAEYQSLRDSLNNKISEQDIADIAASFQNTASDILIDRLNNSINHQDVRNLINQQILDKVVIAGGVAANQYIFTKINNFLQSHQLKLIAPPINLCTDNALMIAWAAVENLFCPQHNFVDNLHNLKFKPRSNWPLDNIDKTDNIAI
jgi:N6-L-threonylcarbamoyladenine synthase